jgi:hypothetical protein
MSESSNSTTASPSGKSNLASILFAALVVLLVGSAIVYYFVSGKGDPAAEIDDLSFLPANGYGFAVLRIADVWKTEGAQKALARQPKLADRIEAQVGLRPEEIERASIAFFDYDNELAWGVIRTIEPYDRAKVLSHLKDAREKQHGKRRYWVGTASNGQPLAWHFASSRVIVVCNEESMYSCLDRHAQPMPGALSPLLAKIETKQHGLAAAVLPESVRKRVSGPFKNMLQPFLDVQTATAEIQLAEKATIEVRAQLANADKANALAKALPTTLGFANLMLPQVPGLSSDDREKFLKNLKPETKENEMILTMSGDAGQVAAGILGVLGR